MSEYAPRHVEREPQAPPRIYVASQSDLKAGHLHGTWLDATKDLGELMTEVVDMLDRSPTPDAWECSIFAHEGFGGIPIGEHDDLSVVSKLASGVQRYRQNPGNSPRQQRLCRSAELRLPA